MLEMVSTLARMLRKAAAPISSREARRLIEDYLAWEVVVNDGASIVRATVQAAEQAGASFLYSEDLSHGQQYGSVEVVDPLT